MLVSRRALTATAASLALVAAGYLGFDMSQSTRLALAVPPVQKTSAPQLSALQDLSSVFREVGQTVEPSVVNIRVTKMTEQTQAMTPFGGPMFRRFFRNFGGGNAMPLPPEELTPRELPEVGTGSGVIMDASNGVGYILTNNHVAGGAKEMEVTLADGRVIRNAKLVGADPKTDLAVVEIKADHLTPAKWGDSSTLRQGDWVVAFGSPFGYVGSMTHGIVSALHRQTGILGSGGYENFIQVDAPINPGNSGGPLVNLQGDVVGINTAIASSSGGFQGVGLAVPSDEAKPIYEALKDNGKVVRGWLGLEIASVNQLRDQAKSAGYKGDTGVLVKGVLSGSPAAGKLQPADVITQLNGKPVKDATELRDQVALMAPGTDVTLGITRDGRSQDLKVKLGEQPGNTNVLANRTQRGPEEKALGLKLANPTGDLEQRFGVSGQGAMVVGVDPTSPAGMAGIHTGDLITKIGDHDVHGAKDARDLLANADLKKGVGMYLSNREGSEYVFVQAS